ncbi:MAG: SDR family oxidoreductase [Devosia sp.]
MTKPVLFVSGANGKLGRRVMNLLVERGYEGKIIAGTRNPEAISFPNIEVRKSDFDDPAELASALAGVDRLLIISTSSPRRAITQVGAVAAAKAAGVSHITYTSAPSPTVDSPIPFVADHRLTEEAIANSGVPHTILRNMWYTENLLDALPPALASGRWYSAAGNGRLAYVTREDAARAAVGALLEEPRENRTLTVTGPDLLTTSEIGAIASAVTGKPLEVVPVNDEQLAAGAIAAGVPRAVVDAMIVPIERNTREGRVDIVSDAVEQLWGVRPTGVRAFLEANRAALSA